MPYPSKRQKQIRERLRCGECGAFLNNLDCALCLNRQYQKRKRKQKDGVKTRLKRREVQVETVAQQELDKDGMTVESECQESNAMDNIMAEADNDDSEYVQHAQSKRKEVEVEKTVSQKKSMETRLLGSKPVEYQRSV